MVWGWEGTRFLFPSLFQMSIKITLHSVAITSFTFTKALNFLILFRFTPWIETYFSVNFHAQLQTFFCFSLLIKTSINHFVKIEKTQRRTKENYRWFPRHSHSCLGNRWEKSYSSMSHEFFKIAKLSSACCSMMRFS